ncbi:MAG TPA: hypothetical protein VD973_30030 [Symbiobacteriaceae bacterium]|nr:hypothetical protein [Symbiobacteriaceae bacterium]
MEQLALTLREEYGLTLHAATHIDYGMWEESFRIETSLPNVSCVRTGEAKGCSEALC